MTCVYSVVTICQVYVLVETLVDSLCVLSDALQDDAADELQHKELMNCVPGI